MNTLLKGMIAAIAATCLSVAPAQAEQASAPTTTPPPAVTLAPEVSVWLNDCTDWPEVYVDPATGSLYGDQDGNGRLDGDDCNWR